MENAAGFPSASPRPPEPTGFTHLCPAARRCITPTACPRESGGRPGPRAGAQPWFSWRPRRSGLLSTGCGGIPGQGWVPAFAGTTKRGRKPAQQGQQARRRQAGMRCVHAVGPRAGASLRRRPCCRRSRIGVDAPSGTTAKAQMFLLSANDIRYIYLHGLHFQKMCYDGSEGSGIHGPRPARAGPARNDPDSADRRGVSCACLVRAIRRANRAGADTRPRPHANARDKGSPRCRACLVEREPYERSRRTPCPSSSLP